ncbi:MAG: cytochrome C [Flammeovirgaceae bacterium]|nr:cytochrome C [Flammeovirgaceae bacterium]
MSNNYLFLFSLFILILSCNSYQKPSESCLPENLDKASKMKFTQYLIQGKILYNNNCTHCHQNSGKGFRKLYPSLISSTALMDNIGPAACLVKYGTIHSQKNSNISIPMPAKTELNNLEIAEILTYIGNSWGNRTGFISVKKVATSLVNCTTH